MTEGPGILLTLLAFVLVLGPLVFLHEMGHYLAGRWFGVKAEEFSIGFGREVAGFTDKRGTRWKFGWLPLGGYVRFAGDMSPASQPSAEWLELPAAERARTFQAKPLWQRAIIVAAGPIANFLIAIVILSGFAMLIGKVPAQVGVVTPNSAAAAAGIQPGDRILSMGGREIDGYVDLRQYTMLRPGETVEIELLRGNEQFVRDVTIGVERQRDRFGNEYRIGRLGIGSTPGVYEPVGLIEAPIEGVKMTAMVVRSTFDLLGQIITGRRSIADMGGPLKIAQVSGEKLSMGWLAFVELIALISISLGFINLLPIPVLDGGHLFFYAIEAVRRRPLEPQVQEWAFRGGLLAILTLMVVVTFNDLGSFGVWRNLAGLIG